MDIDRLPVAEAAKRLGISNDALRKRIKRGSVDAQQDGAGQWWVLLPADATRTGGDGTGQRPDAGGDASGQADQAPLLQRIRDLEAERDYLRRQLEATNANMHMILRALPAPSTTPAEASPIQNAPRRRRWWQLWG